MSLDTASPPTVPDDTDDTDDTSGYPADLDCQLIEHIEQNLPGYLARHGEDTARVHPTFAEAAIVLTEFVRGGGKRIRRRSPGGAGGARVVIPPIRPPRRCRVW